MPMRIEARLVRSATQLGGMIIVGIDPFFPSLWKTLPGRARQPTSAPPRALTGPSWADASPAFTDTRNCPKWADRIDGRKYHDDRQIDGEDSYLHSARIGLGRKQPHHRAPDPAAARGRTVHLVQRSRSLQARRRPRQADHAGLHHA